MRIECTNRISPKNRTLASCFFTVQYSTLRGMGNRTSKIKEMGVVEGEEEATEPIPQATARPKLDLEGFRTAVAGLKPNDAPVLYINRLEPPVKKELSGRRFTYIEKLTELPADIYGHLKAIHGGGKYELLLNADNRRPNSVAKCILEVPLAEADPILDIRELVRGGPATEQLVRKWKQEGKVAELPTGELVAIAPGQPAPGAPAQASTNQVFERFMARAVDQVFERQGSSIGELVSVMREAREQAKEQGGGNVATEMLLKFTLDQLAAAQQREANMVQQLFEIKTGRNTGRQSDGLDVTVSTLKTLSETFGIQTNGGGNAPHWAVALVSELGKVAAPMLGAFMLMKQGITPGMPTAPPSTPPAALPEQAGAAPAPPPQQVNPQLAEMHRFGARVLQLLDKDRPGDEFAMSLVDMMGDEAYERLKQAGAPTLTAALRSFPDLAPEFDRRADKLQTFLQAFVTAFDEPEASADAA